MIGPGKYDELCTAAREAAKASTCILIIMDGDKGPGFSVQAPPDVMQHLPKLLQYVAGYVHGEVLRDERDAKK